MRAVSNTSPISGLAYIGRLDLLRSQFSEVWIPAAVVRELRAHPDPTSLAAIETAISEDWIKLASMTTSHLFNLLSLHLHSGEAEAIALAAEMKADVVLIDEQEGRQFAAQAGISVTGALGVLLRARLKGDIPALKPEIQALRTNARFFIARSLEAKLLSAAGE